MPIHLTSYTAPRRQTGAAALRPVARWSLAAIAGAWLLVAGQAHASVIIQRSLSIGLNNGLVGWWTFDGKDIAGNVGYDRSDAGHNAKLVFEVGTIIETQSYTTSASSTYTPTVDGKAVVEVWGAGGGGGVSANGEGGGGGGAYSRRQLNLIGGTGYTVSVGAEGAAAKSGSDSYFIDTSTVLAKGGSGGSASNGGAGGSSSSGAGDVTFSGGNGGNGGFSIGEEGGGGGGGSATTGAGGGNGSNYSGVTGGAGGTGAGNGGNGGNTSANGSNGNAPGGGGGGGGKDGNAGTGAVGKVLISLYSSLSRPAIGRIGQAAEFTGSSDYASIGNVGTVQTVSFWMKPDITVSEKIIDMNGTAQIELNGSGNVAATSFPAAAVYVDGVKATAMSRGWHHVAIVDTTGVNASAMDIGRVSTSYFKGFIDDVRIYNRALSADEIKRLYKIGGTAKINTSISGPTNGLVGWWTFDGKDMAGNYTFDKSGNGNRGTLTGTDGVPVRTLGKLGQGLSFDGVDDYVTSSSFSWPTTNSEITVSFWNYAAVGVNGNAFSIGLQGPPDLIEVYAPFTDNNFYWDYGDTAANGRISTNYASYLNKWTHVAVVSKGNSGNFKGIYLNGVLAASSNVSDGPNNNVTGIEIGRWTGANYKGTLDDFRVYNRALSADEIKRLYNLGGTVKLNTTLEGPKSGLVGWWTFDGKDMAGNYAFDKSGNGNRGTLTGSNGVPTRTLGKIGQGMAFDGVDDYVEIADNDAFSIDTTNFLTVSLWVKPRNFSIRGKPIGKGGSGGSLEWDIWAENDGNFYGFVWTTAPGTYLRADGAGNYKTDQWHHVVFVVNLNVPVAKLYVNGVFTGEDTTPSGTLRTNNAITLTIGQSNSDEFNGLIDDVRIYNRALSADEIKRLYNLGR